MAKGRKRAKWKENPGPVRKVPKGTEKAEAHNSSRFQWRCTWIDLAGDWGFENVPSETIWGEIIPRLHDLENNTWGEIYGKRDGSTHPMPVDKIETPAAGRLREIGRGVYDTLFQINVRAGIRLWGIRDRAIFYLIWYDPDHTVYIQKK